LCCQIPFPDFSVPVAGQQFDRDAAVFQRGDGGNSVRPQPLAHGKDMALRPATECDNGDFGIPAQNFIGKPVGAAEGRVAEPDFDALVVSGFFIGTVTLPGLPYRYALPHLTLRGDGPIDTIMARLLPAQRDRLVDAFTTFAQAAGELPDDAWKLGWTA
jgi:hypothetical protein